MSFDEWWEEYRSEHAIPIAENRGIAEDVWNEALRETWLKVFQIVSDNPQMFTREAIRKLEALREADGQGPLARAA